MRQRRAGVNIAEDKRDRRGRRGILKYSRNDEEVNLYFTLHFHHPPRSFAGCWQRQRENLGDRVEGNRRASIVWISLPPVAHFLKTTPSPGSHLRVHLGHSVTITTAGRPVNFRTREIGRKKLRQIVNFQARDVWKKFRHLPQRLSSQNLSVSFENPSPVDEDARDLLLESSSWPRVARCA